ncbi:MAG: CHAT domain-containing protein, partial [Cyanobacteriota bacterium]|nr:CHAT domain-containing protein [Cyanobacteriota bacterium]
PEEETETPEQGTVDEPEEETVADADLGESDGMTPESGDSGNAIDTGEIAVEDDENPSGGDTPPDTSENPEPPIDSGNNANLENPANPEQPLDSGNNANLENPENLANPEPPIDSGNNANLENPANPEPPLDSGENANLENLENLEQPLNLEEPSLEPGTVIVTLAEDNEGNIENTDRTIDPSILLSGVIEGIAGDIVFIARDDIKIAIEPEASDTDDVLDISEIEDGLAAFPDIPEELLEEEPLADKYDYLQVVVRHIFAGSITGSGGDVVLGSTEGSVIAPETKITTEGGESDGNITIFGRTWETNVLNAGETGTILTFQPPVNSPAIAIPSNPILEPEPAPISEPNIALAPEPPSAPTPDPIPEPEPEVSDRSISVPDSTSEPELIREPEPEPELTPEPEPEPEFTPEPESKPEPAPSLPIPNSTFSLTKLPPTSFADEGFDFEEFRQGEFDESTSDETLSPAVIREMLQNIQEQSGGEISPGVIYAQILAPSVQLSESKSSLIAANKPQLVLYLISPDGSSQGQLVRIESENIRDNLQSQIQRLQRQLNQPHNEDYLATAQQLYRWLIEPLEAELGDLNTLMFSMGSELRSIPLAALHDGEQFLIEKYAISTIPSVSLTDATYEGLKGDRILAMGASDFTHSGQNSLPAVRTELQTILDRWPESGHLFFNEDFTNENLRKMRQQQHFGIVHLATHASSESVAESGTPHIQFWDRALSFEDLRQHDWHSPGNPVELLVLSACATAVENPESELGFAGLAVRAGVKSAIASMWPVQDTSTLGLMGELYHQLQRQSTKAEALREAQIAMIRGEVRIEGGEVILSETTVPLPPEQADSGDRDFSHPHFWAGFTTIGSPW